jgi:hypothetical protein
MKGPTKTPAIGLPRIARSRVGLPFVAMLVLLQAFASRPAAGAALDGVFEVRSAYLTVDEGVFLLNVRTEYPVNEEIRSALTDGVTLYFDLEARVERSRRLWLDATLVELTLRRELSWHAVRERYVVRDVVHGEQEFYLTLERALQAVGSISAFPVVTEPQLATDAAYQISVRASMRRGSMPDALRTLIWWSDSWHRSTDWYTWSLPR